MIRPSTSGRRLRPCLERARLDARREARRRDRPQGRREAAARRLPGGAAHAGRRRRARLRLLRLLRPQALRPDRDRRALGAGRDPRGDAALAGRRRDDRPGDVREDHLSRRRRRGSRRGRRTSSARSASMPRSTMSTASASTRSHAHESALVARSAAPRCRAVNGVRLFGPEDSAGIVSFAVEGVHPHDIGTILDEAGVAIRAGHHCAQPLMDISASPRPRGPASACITTRADIEALVRGHRAGEADFRMNEESKIETEEVDGGRRRRRARARHAPRRSSASATISPASCAEAAPSPKRRRPAATSTKR